VIPEYTVRGERNISDYTLPKEVDRYENLEECEIRLKKSDDYVLNEKKEIFDLTKQR
jgi:hypothetical protein